MSKKFKYRIVFLRQINSIYVIEKSLTFKSSVNESITFKDRTYIINYSMPAYLRKNVYIYFIDMNTSEQLMYSRIGALIDPKLLKIMLKSNIMSQISKSLSDEVRKPNYALIILYVVIGALLGGMGVYIYCSQKMITGV